MFLVEQRLDVPVEQIIHGLRHRRGPEEPEAAATLGFPLRCSLYARAILLHLFLLVYSQVFINGLVVFFEIFLVVESVDRPGREPIGGALHLSRQRVRPFEVDNTRDIPLLVDKDVIRDKVVKRYVKRPLTRVWIDKVVHNGAHPRAGRELLFPVIDVRDGIWLAAQLCVLQREQVREIAVHLGIGLPARYPRRDALALQHVHV